MVGVCYMSDKVLVITDGGRNIAFKKMITFYELELLDLVEFNFRKENGYSLIIIDTVNEEKSISVGNICRLESSWIPILILVDSKTSLKEEFKYVKNIKGTGTIKLVRWKKKYPYELMDNIQNLMNPSYPVTPNNIAIIIPIYNEEARFNYIYDFITKLKILLQNGLANASIYFLNDGSTDNTEKLVDLLMDNYSKGVEWIDDKASISYYKLNYNTRKAGTYIESLSSIRASIVIFVDADDSFEIEDIAKMINILSFGYYDIVIGTKDLSAENRTVKRKIVSFFKRVLTKSFLPEGVTDSQTGLKAINWDCAKYILPYLHENMQLAIDLEMMYIAKKLKFRVLQLEVKCIDREGSHVNLLKDSRAFVKNLSKIKKMNKYIGKTY